VIAPFFAMPARNRNQSPEVDYLCLDGMILARSLDRSNGKVSYSLAKLDDEDWSWYASYEPGGALEPPPIADDRWTPIDEDRADAIMADAGVR
jgi:hypothetical protein